MVRQDRKGETRQEQNGVLVMCQTEVLNAIEWDEVVTTKIIGERIGVPIGQVSDDLRALQKYGLVKVIGKDNRWKLRVRS